VLVTAAVVVSVKVKSTYCAAAFTMAVPLVVNPLIEVQVALSAAVPIVNALRLVFVASKYSAESVSAH
jgi:hypothetical protein